MGGFEVNIFLFMVVNGMVFFVLDSVGWCVIVVVFRVFEVEFVWLGYVFCIIGWGVDFVCGFKFVMVFLVVCREFCFLRVVGFGVVLVVFDMVMVGGGGGLLVLKVRFVVDDIYCDGGDDGVFGCCCVELVVIVVWDLVVLMGWFLWLIGDVLLLVVKSVVVEVDVLVMLELGF